MKLFSYQHRHSDFDPSYYRLYSPSGLSLCLVNCDKDTQAFISEANKPLTEANELSARTQQAVEKLKDVQGRDGFDNKQLAEAISLLSPVQKMDD